MKPGRRIFASNAVWAAGPDAGVATKLPMSAGELADGRYRSIRPAPQLDNHELWNLTSRLDNLSSLRLMNLTTEPVTGAGWPGAWIGVAPDGIYDPTPTRRTHTAVDASGALASLEYTSRGGRLWTALAGAPVAMAAPRIAVDGTDTRALVLYTAASQVWYSNAYAVWATWPAAGVAAQWQDIDYGGIGANARWVVISAAGSIARSTGPGVDAFSAPLTAPGFAASTMHVVAYSHHYAGDVYPSDPGNHMWLALTDTQCSVSTSANANVWSAAALHAIGAVPGDVGYSRLTGQWIAIDHLCGIDRSVDGLVWTRSAMGTANGLPATTVAPTTGRIATDGYGHWMAILIEAWGGGAGAGTAEIFASHDDGATWAEVFPDVVIAQIDDGCLWYGDGAFHVMVETGVTGAIYSTLRTVD